MGKRTVHKILECFCLDIDATKTAVLAGVNRKTANRVFMCCRLAIFWWRSKRRKECVDGEIEVDESYHGAKRKRGFHGKLKRGRGTKKQPVFGIFEREGEVFTELVPDCKKKTLQALILKRILLESVIYSDGWRGYNGLVDVGYDKHFRVNHGENEFSKGKGVHINGIESFWSYTKRRLRKFNGLSKTTFDLHLKECEWRWKKNKNQLRQELCGILKLYARI
ncbi:MAG: IS1595 family transposase [Candidatus Pacebacteria bacterium]|nr:IS1595 family transposase [Candidatus Paceibacterota bacterium]